MIEVTALNDHQFYLNPDLIYRIDMTPDTMITFIDSKTLVVKETPEQLVEKIKVYRRQIVRPWRKGE